MSRSPTLLARARTRQPATPARPPTPATRGPDDLAAPLSPAALAVLLAGVLLPVTDFFIVNVALPTMAETLHASPALLELVVAGYATAYAVLLVLGGRLGDVFGRRRLFVWGMAAFTTASLLCGVAPTAVALVVFRLLQGAAAALMVPQVLSTIQATGDSNTRARGLGWYGATAGIAAVVGQVVGGILVSLDIAGSGWRPIFLVNVPLGIVGLVLATRLLPETRPSDVLHIDVPGTVLLAAAVSAFLIPLTEGAQLGWPLWSLILLGTVPVLGGLFARAEVRAHRSGKTPLVPPSVVAIPSMRRGLLMIGPFFAGFGAFMFVYALVFQGHLGLTPVRAGLTLAPFGLAFLLTSLQLPRLAARWGNRIIATGALIQFIGLAAFGVTLLASWPHVDLPVVAGVLAVAGVGQGIAVPALFRLVLSDVPVHDAGAASGVLNTTLQICLALGVATLGTLFVHVAPVARLGPLDAALIVVAALMTVALGIVIRAGRGGDRSTSRGETALAVVTAQETAA